MATPLRSSLPMPRERSTGWSQRAVQLRVGRSSRVCRPSSGRSTARPPRSSRKGAKTVSSVVYADASALIKLVVREPESRSLVAAIPARADVVTSVVSIAEVARCLRVAGLVEEIEVVDVMDVLDGVALVGTDRAIARAAAGIASESLRPLDAIHLATALAVAPDVMLVYDRRLAAGAAASGIRVETPGAHGRT